MKISYIRLLFDYPCYPVWLYDQDGMCIDTTLPEEWQNGSELDSLLLQLQDAYNALFTDNEKEFDYVGFNSDEEKDAFILLMDTVVGALYEKNNGRYRIVNDLKI